MHFYAQIQRRRNKKCLERKPTKENITEKKKKKAPVHCVFLCWGKGGDHLPLSAHPRLQPEAFGGPWVPEENISASVTPEPSAELFTLARPPDSFTDVTYRHTGTLTQRMERELREEEEEERKARERRSKEDEKRRKNGTS